MLNSSEDKQGVGPTRADRTALGELYPTPKTYDDRTKEQADREQRRLQQIPRHFTLYIAVRVFILVIISVLIYILSPILIMWMFNLVLCVLVLLGLAKLLTADISSAFDKKGLNSAAFYTLYMLIIAPLTAIALYAANTQSHIAVTILIYVAAFLLHYVAIGLVISLMVRAQNQ